MAGCTLRISCRLAQVVLGSAAELQALIQDKGLLLLSGWVENALGWCQVEAGEFEPGIARLRRLVQRGADLPDLIEARALLVELNGKWARAE